MLAHMVGNMPTYTHTPCMCELHTYMHECICACTHARAFVASHAYINYIHACTIKSHTYFKLCMCACTRYTTHMHTHLRASPHITPHGHTHMTCTHGRRNKCITYMHPRATAQHVTFHDTHAWIHAYIYARICFTDTYMHARMDEYMHTSEHTCMHKMHAPLAYAHTHTHTHTHAYITYTHALQTTQKHTYVNI